MQCLTWSTEGGREEVGEILFLWPHLHTGRVVASSQTSAVLHNTVQTEEEKRRLMMGFPIVMLYLYLILLFLMSTLGMARLVEEQKGARSRSRGKLTCLFSFLQPDIVCWNLLRWRVKMAGGQKINSCLLAGE